MSRLGPEESAKRLHFFERGLFGFVGATLVVSPSVANWFDERAHYPSLWAVKFVEMASLGAMVLVWLVAVYVTAREEESHWWSSFFKAVGIPGSLLSAGKIFEVFVN